MYNKKACPPQNIAYFSVVCSVLRLFLHNCMNLPGEGEFCEGTRKAVQNTDRKNGTFCGGQAFGCISLLFNVAHTPETHSASQFLPEIPPL